MESDGSVNAAEQSLPKTEMAKGSKDQTGDLSVKAYIWGTKDQLSEHQFPPIERVFMKENQKVSASVDSGEVSMKEYVSPGEPSVYQESEQMASGNVKEEFQMTDIIRDLITEDEKKIFVGGLDDQISDYDLVEYFSKFGDVEFVNTIRNHVTGENRGFAFVTFVMIHGLQNALAEAKHEIKGKTLGVYKANPRSGRMYIGNLNKDITDADIYENFSKFGKILKIERPAHPERRNVFCFVVFQTMDTVKRVLSYGKITIKGQLLKAELAKAKPAKMPWYGFYNPNPFMHNPIYMQEVQENVQTDLDQTVFIGGLSSGTTEADLKLQFGAFGNIRSVRIVQDRATKKSRGFGFITFEEVASAEKVLEKGSHIVNGKRCGTRKAEAAKNKNPEQGVEMFEGSGFQEWADPNLMPQGMNPAGTIQMPYFPWGVQPVMQWNPYYQ